MSSLRYKAFFSEATEEKDFMPYVYMASYLSTNYSADEIIEIIKDTYGEEEFLYGSCAVLACFLDLLFGDKNSGFGIILDECDYELFMNTYNGDVTTEHLLELSEFAGFPHVLWHDGEYYNDILGKYENIDDAVENSEGIIIFNSPKALIVGNKNINHSLYSRYLSIVSGTSSKRTVLELLSSIYFMTKIEDCA